MIEIVILIVAASGLAAFVTRRGGKRWLWVAAFILGYVVLGSAARELLGAGAQLPLLVIWAALFYGLVFLLVGCGRRAAEPWKCPDCGVWNECSTLRCPCGRELPSETQVGG